MNKAIKLSWFLLGIVVVLILCELVGMRLLRQYNYFFRAVPLQDMSGLDYVFPYETPQKIGQLCGDTYQDTLKNVMNFVSCAVDRGSPTSEHVGDFFDHAKLGGSLTCNGMSELYVHALRLQGIKARKIFVVKNFGDPYQSHTLVEIFIDGKWRIFDPTFHASFEKNGELLGAQDIAQALIDGSFITIAPIFYGEVVYPYRLPSYYMHWLSLYNNVLFFQYGKYSPSWIVRNTIEFPLRYWNGPVLYYFSQDGNPNRYFELLDTIYFLIVCVIPLSVVFYIFLLMLCLLVWFIKKRKIIYKKG